MFAKSAKVLLFVSLVVSSVLNAAHASMVVYAQPSDWSEATGFTGSLNGGQDGWFDRVGSRAQPFDGSSVRSDLNWQCPLTGPGCPPIFSTVTANPVPGLGSFSMVVDIAPSGSRFCGNVLCNGNVASTFFLSKPIYALAFNVSVFLGCTCNLFFDGIPIMQFDTVKVDGGLGPFVALSDIFFGVISDAAFSSFTISSPDFAFDTRFTADFTDILVSTHAVDEPPSYLTFAVGIVLLGGITMVSRTKRLGF
jgi:hypothetical protein